MNILVLDFQQINIFISHRQGSVIPASFLHSAYHHWSYYLSYLLFWFVSASIHEDVCRGFWVSAVLCGILVPSGSNMVDA